MRVSVWGGGLRVWSTERKRDGGVCPPSLYSTQALSLARRPVHDDGRVEDWVAGGPREAHLGRDVLQPVVRTWIDREGRKGHTRILSHRQPHPMSSLPKHLHQGAVLHRHAPAKGGGGHAGGGPAALRRPPFVLRLAPGAVRAEAVRKAPCVCDWSAPQNKASVLTHVLSMCSNREQAAAGGGAGGGGAHAHHAGGGLLHRGGHERRQSPRKVPEGEHARRPRHEPGLGLLPVRRHAWMGSWTDEVVSFRLSSPADVLD